MNSELSGRVSTAAATAGSVKLGQPVPESNLVADENSSAPQPAHRYTPSCLTFQYLPVNARSVPPLRSTSYCSGVSSSRHCSSVLWICSVAMPRGYDARPSNHSRVVTIARMRIAASRGRMAADVLLSALAVAEPATLDHAREVAELARAVAQRLGLDRRAREHVARAAELHDIGKMA